MATKEPVKSLSVSYALRQHRVSEPWRAALQRRSLGTYATRAPMSSAAAPTAPQGMLHPSLLPGLRRNPLDELIVTPLDFSDFAYPRSLVGDG
jgi:hypothetical protein